MLNRIPALSLVIFWLAIGGSYAHAEELVGTLALDSGSFISFGNQEELTLPAGSLIRFHFGDAQPDGSVPFSISPSDVQIPGIPVPGDRELDYSIASATSGTLEPSDSGLKMSFSASVSVVLSGGPVNPSSATYPTLFTTEQILAINADHDDIVTAQGSRLNADTKAIRLVTGVTNRTDGFMAPGEAVAGVLTGTFDQIPSMGE